MVFREKGNISVSGAKTKIEKKMSYKHRFVNAFCSRVMDRYCPKGVIMQ